MNLAYKEAREGKGTVDVEKLKEVLINIPALVDILVEKGIFTDEEFIQKQALYRVIVGLGELANEPSQPSS